MTRTKTDAPIAQTVEQPVLNRTVEGSTPPRCTIFLDIDGVLNTPGTWGAWVALGYAQALEPILVARFAALAERVDAHVVLSSTWRLACGLDGTRSALIERGWQRADRLIDETPHMPERGRGAEIEAWLDIHPEVERWVVLDDDAGRMGAVKAKLVHVEGWQGLSEADVAKALTILGA